MLSFICFFSSIFLLTRFASGILQLPIGKDQNAWRRSIDIKALDRELCNTKIKCYSSQQRKNTSVRFKWFREHGFDHDFFSIKNKLNFILDAIVQITKEIIWHHFNRFIWSQPYNNRFSPNQWFFGFLMYRK